MTGSSDVCSSDLGQRQEFGFSDSVLLLVNGSTAFFVTFSDGLDRQISSSSSSLLQSPA